MKGGYIELSLMMVLVVLVSVGLGFVGGYYYEKQQSHKQIKENFAMSQGAQIGIGVAVGVVVLVLFIGFYFGKDSSENVIGRGGRGRRYQ
jgi:hypothetical protein